MKKKNVKTILSYFFATSLFVVFTLLLPKTSFAQISCPSHIEPESIACLDYLREQMTKLERDQGSVQKRLKDEEYQQLNIRERIEYTNREIAQAENIIKGLEIEIAAYDVEIRLLEKIIKEKEDNVSVLGQEINVLEEAVTKRVAESYKFSFVGPLELFLDLRNLSSVLRKTKYLAVTRTQDRIYLEEFGNKREEIKEEEAVLAEKRASVQVKRNAIDENKIELAQEREALTASRAELSNLLAESRRREAEFQAQLKEISQAIASVDEAVTDLINHLYDTGQLADGSRVWQGTLIGRQGHTGCSYGSHLHFEIRNTNGQRVNPLSGYLTLGAGNRILPGIYITPVSGPLLTGGFTGSHQAIDMVSLTDGNQNLQMYTVPWGLCPIVDGILTRRRNAGDGNWNRAYLTGEGAAVRAISSGTVYYGTDWFGGKWALVVHDNGERSFYLHLQ